MEKTKNKNKLIKRMSALLCALVVAASCLGSTEYRADIEPSNVNEFLGLCGLPQFENYNSNYGYVVVIDYRNKVCLTEIKEDGFLYLDDTNDLLYKFSKGTSYTLVDNVWNKGSEDYTTSGSYAWGYWDKPYTSIPLLYFDMTLYSNKNQDSVVCGSYSKVKDMGVVDVVYPARYNSQIGYLINVTSKKMIIDGDKQGTQTKYKFSFDTTSSSGVDLTSGDYVIKLYEQTSIYKGGIWQPFSCPRVHIGDFDASKGYLDFNIADAMTKTDAVTGDIEGYDFLSIALNNYVRADSYYLQIYNKITAEYGGFVEMKNNPNLPGQFTLTTHHGNENDMSSSDGTDMNGYVDKIVDTNIGIGTDYENAELDADRNDGLDSVGELSDSLNDLASSISSIPQIIGSMFSFLPPWCLGLTAVGFGLLVILIVVKSAL